MLPLAVSQSFTVLSSLAVARHRPSGLKVTSPIGWQCSWKVQSFSPLVVFHRRSILMDRSETFSNRTEGHGHGWGGGLLESAELLSGHPIREDHRSVTDP
jgi:hypothetical protein